MSDQETVWFGMLDAGASSSPVARDTEFDTGNPATVYLFNLKRGVIGEYRRDIVEAKLRNLQPDEEHVLQELGAAFDKARGGFVPRKRRSSRAAESVRRALAREYDDDEDDEVLPPELEEDAPLLEDDADYDDDEDEEG